MKITMEFSKDDILQMIHKQLDASGLQHDIASAKYKGTAKVTIEVEGQLLDVEAVAVETATPRRERAAVLPTELTNRGQLPPVEEETSAEDMNQILAMSNKNASQKKPLYPAAPTRTMLEGEEPWPETPEPGGR
jgi:hypothetical protein